ncbi:hypothetical protein [Pseudonocardia sp. NPDC049154]|uniref:hypothetical protein n=1 Tax=Pseudonocardia sp. NPDC049154 TaxID=3155501 RepID=UPI0033C2190A
MTVAVLMASKRPLDLREVVVDDRLVAVQREAHQPTSETEFLGDLVDDRVGHRTLAVVPVRASGQHGRHAEGVGDLRTHVDRAVEHEAAQRVDHGGHL